MFRTELLLILPLVVAVTVGHNMNSGYSYYGTSNVRDQRLLPIYGQRPLLPLPAVTAAGEAPAAPAPVLDESSASTAPPTLAASSYAPVRRPWPLYTPVYRPLLPSRPIRPAPPAAALPQPPTIAETLPTATGTLQPPVTEAVPPLQPVDANTPKVPILPEPAVEQPETATIPILASQPEELVIVEPLHEAVPTGELGPVSEQSPASEPIQTSAVVSKPIPQPEPIRQPEPALPPDPISEPEPIQQPEPVLQPEYIPQPEPTQEIEQAQKTAVLPERVAVPFPEPPSKSVSAPAPTSLASSINVPQSRTPVALPPLLPKPEPVRELAFGWHRQSSVPPMINNPIVTYPTPTRSYSWTVATQVPPVVVTTQSHPAVTQASGQLKFDFQCKKGNEYYSVEHECDTYIECKQNRAMKYACPDGLHFNPDAKRYEYPCAYPSEVKCMAGDQEQTPKPTAKCPNQYGFYSMNDGDCSQFIMCQEGSATIMNCPLGLAFNPQTSSCDWPANVPRCNPNVFKDFICPDPPEDEDGQVSDIIYKYRYDRQCKLYIACQLGHPRLLSCERGLFFDDASQTCIDEDYVTDCSDSDLEQ